jgi:hypothetical protein
LVEDNPDQVLLTERAFKRQNGDMQVVSVKDGQLASTGCPGSDFLP